MTGQRVQIRRHPGEHPVYPRLIKVDTFRRILGVRAEVDDHHLATLQLRQPIEAPSQHFHLIGNPGLHHRRGCRVSSGGFPIGWVVTPTQVCQPCGHLASFSSLEELMETAATQARRGGHLSDGETGVTCCDDGPDPLVFGLVQPHRCQA
jgi:hypothetical protein